MSSKQEELFNMAATKLRAIAEEMAGGEEGQALWHDLERVGALDMALADALLTRFTAFLTEHAKRVAVQFFREGEQAGLATAAHRLQQKERHRSARLRSGRLQ